MYQPFSVMPSEVGNSTSRYSGIPKADGVLPSLGSWKWKRLVVITLVRNQGNLLLVYARPLEDGSKAVAFYNLASKPVRMMVKWNELGISGGHSVRDLWREKNLGRSDDEFSMTVASHSAELVKISE